MGALMKYFVGAFLVVVLITGYFLNKSNKEDVERLKRAEVAHQQKLEREKVDEAKAIQLSAQRQAEEVKTKVLHEDKISQAKADNESVSVKQQEKPASGNKYSEEEWLSICKSTSSTAKSIMNSRQRGASMVDMMDKVVGSADPAIKEIVKAFVIDAYNQPRFDTLEYQQKAELDFENNAYLTCIKVRQ